ncbi:MAG: cupin domain-containing protein [Dehalococcoidia bacterium]
MPESILKVETDRVRVTESRLLPGDQTGHHRHEHDYVVVPLTGGELTIVDAGGNATKFVTATGDAYARPQGVEHNVLNLTDREIRFTEIELLGG